MPATDKSNVVALVRGASQQEDGAPSHRASPSAIDGMSVLSARGIESEAQVPFGGLLELLRPALVALDRIPEPQAAALAGALALRPARAQDRFMKSVAATLRATPLSFCRRCRAAAGARSMTHAHWLRACDRQVRMLSLIRRLVADPIAVVLTVREEERSLLDGADLAVLRIDGLDPLAAAASSLRRESPTGPARGSPDWEYLHTASNHAGAARN